MTGRPVDFKKLIHSLTKAGLLIERGPDYLLGDRFIEEYEKIGNRLGDERRHYVLAILRKYLPEPRSEEEKAELAEACTFLLGFVED